MWSDWNDIAIFLKNGIFSELNHKAELKGLWQLRKFEFNLSSFCNLAPGETFWQMKPKQFLIAELWPYQPWKRVRNSYWEFPSFGNQHTNIEIIVMNTQNINDIMQILNDRKVRRECQIGKRKQKRINYRSNKGQDHLGAKNRLLEKAKYQIKIHQCLINKTENCL